MNFTYNLSETEYLVFKPNHNYFELYSGHEAGSDLKKIANYKGGKWVFDGYEQKKLFWFLYSIYKNNFGKALKQYIRSLDEKPKTYVVVCAKRRFDIKIHKLKRSWDNWFYSTFYSR